LGFLAIIIDLDSTGAFQGGDPSVVLPCDRLPVAKFIFQTFVVEIAAPGDCAAGQVEIERVCGEGGYPTAITAFSAL
jgi:hypothetical protein